MLIARIADKGADILQRLEKSPRTVEVAEIDSWHSQAHRAIIEAFGADSPQLQIYKNLHQSLTDEHLGNPRRWDEISATTNRMRSFRWLMDEFTRELPDNLPVKDSKGSNNHLTINLGAGSTFTGPIAVGEIISQSFVTATSVQNASLREKLEQVVKYSSNLVEKIDDEDEKAEISECLAVFVDQAKKEKPSKKLLAVTSKGLLEAAKTVATLTIQITTAVKSVMDLLFPSGTIPM